MYKIGLVRRAPKKWDAYVFHTDDDLVPENIMFTATGKTIRQTLKRIYKDVPRDKVDFIHLVPRKSDD